MTELEYITSKEDNFDMSNVEIKLEVNVAPDIGPLFAQLANTVEVKKEPEIAHAEDNLQQNNLASRILYAEQEKNIKKDDSYLKKKYISRAKAYKFSCAICNKSFSSFSSLAVHMKLLSGDNIAYNIKNKLPKVLLTNIEDGHSPKPKYTCEHCNKTFDIVRLFEKHILYHFKEKKRDVFSCETCGKKFQKKSTLIKHVKVHKRKINANGVLTKSISNGNSIKPNHTTTKIRPYTCRECGNSYFKKIHLKQHMRLHKIHPKSYNCNYCDKQYTQEVSLREHKKTHIDENLALCNICNRRFSCKANMKRHRLTHTSSRQFPCSVCNKLFITKEHRKTHEKIHTKKRNLYGCSVCEKQLASLSSLKSHEKTHTGVKPYTCKYCDRNFARPSHVIQHERVHTGEKPYSCKFCDQKFAQQCNLRKHLRAHVGEKPLSCRFCSRRFLQHSGLKSHERTHTGERPFSCSFCDKKFARKAHKINHELTHSGGNKCDICSKSFSDTYYLKAHMRIHTGEKPYCCDICNKTFRFRNDISYHIKNMHN